MALGFRMNVIGYDPFVTSEMGANIGIEVKSLDDVLTEADFITLHVPRTEETHHLINAERLKTMKEGVRIINCARGGLIDEAALLQALNSGHVAGAGIDVFESEPPSDLGLIEHPNVVSTPHLGASTREAQVRVGTEIAEKIRDFAVNGIILDAVNFPAINRQEFASLGPLMNLSERLGSLLGQIVDDGSKRLEVRTQGSYADASLKPIVMAAVKGLLSPHTEGAVSFVNALARAEERGLTVEESRSNESSSYTGLIRLTLVTDSSEATVAGTLHGDNQPRVVEINGVPIETRPDGHLLLFRNHDVPGVLGKVGRILGEANVNIAGIQLGRVEGTDRAISIVNVDGAVPAEVLQAIRELDEIMIVRTASI